MRCAVRAPLHNFQLGVGAQLLKATQLPGDLQSHSVEMFNLIDADADGLISREEFCTLHGAYVVLGAIRVQLCEWRVRVWLCQTPEFSCSVT